MLSQTKKNSVCAKENKAPLPVHTPQLYQPKLTQNNFVDTQPAVPALVNEASQQQPAYKPTLFKASNPNPINYNSNNNINNNNVNNNSLNQNTNNALANKCKAAKTYFKTLLFFILVLEQI